MRTLAGLSAAIMMLSSPTPGLRAQPSQDAPRAGDAYEITLNRQTSQQGDDGSSGSSQDRDMIVERVIGVRADGLELEYDLPEGATADDRARAWQFPARVFKPYRGSPQLLNRPELEARVDGWLKKVKWPRTACGRWIFTWTAVRVECDPESVIGMIQPFDLRPADLRDGAPYAVAEALGPGTMTRKTSRPDGETFAVEMRVDPDKLRRTRAQSDVAVGEMMQKPVTLDAALAARARESASGTILVTFDTDPAGGVRRRTTVTRIEIKDPAGRSETQTITEIVERERLSGRAVGR